MVGFSIVVKHYRRPYLLRVCLESIAHFWPRAQYDYTVIVADDGTDPLLIDMIYTRLYSTAPSLYDMFIDNPRGAGKWALARNGRFAEVAHTCGDTWNAAYSLHHGDYMFVTEDDSRLIRPFNPEDATAILAAHPDYLCVIGLKQRADLEASGFGTKIGETAVAGVYTHSYWPWSFDSVFLRHSDWAQIGPWPSGVSTADMESWLTARLRKIGFIDRPYAVLNDPISIIDECSRVRVDQDSGKRDAGTYIHADACLRAWVEKSFNPTLEATIKSGSVVYPDWLRSENY